MPNDSESPATLVAIIIAARRSGNRDLEREIRRQLLTLYQVKLIFVQPPAHLIGGVKDET